MRSKIVFILLTLIMAVALSAAYRGPGTFITPEVLVHSHTSLFGVHYETPFSGRLNLGGELAFGTHSPGYLWFSPELIYHFDLDVRKLDLFGGIGPVLTIGFKGGSDFAFKPFGGLRLTIGRKTSFYFKMYMVIGDGSSLGAAFGLSFRL